MKILTEQPAQITFRKLSHMRKIRKRDLFGVMRFRIIGGGAKMAMREAGIALYGGNTGSADDAVRAFLSQTLVQNENPTCDHHHEHGEEHSCGKH